MTTELTTTQYFNPDLNLSEILSENLGGGNISIKDLPDVRVPKNTTWEIGIESVKTIDGIIVAMTTSRTLWTQIKADKDLNDTRPECSSQDGINGTKKENTKFTQAGGACISCPLSKWSSATDESGNPTRGIACKEYRILYLLRPDEILPIKITIPATSLGNLSKYMQNEVTRRAKGYHMVSTRLKLKEIKIPERNIIYSQVEFELGDILEAEQLQAAINYKTMFQRLLAAPVEVLQSNSEVDEF